MAGNAACLMPVPTQDHGNRPAGVNWEVSCLLSQAAHCQTPCRHERETGSREFWPAEGGGATNASGQRREVLQHVRLLPLAERCGELTGWCLACLFCTTQQGFSPCQQTRPARSGKRGGRDPQPHSRLFCLSDLALVISSCQPMCSAASSKCSCLSLMQSLIASKVCMAHSRPWTTCPSSTSTLLLGEPVLL